jgi:predicted DNA-binding transcriptional regulator YafY
MDRYERIIGLHRVLQASRRPVTVARLQDELGCSRATVYRDLAFLRDGLMAPLIGDGEAGFSYDKNEADRFELPGLWLNSEELHALLAAQQLLSRSTGGMLSAAMAPLQQRVEKLLDAHSGGKTWPVERVRVIPHRIRKMDEPAFRIVASSVLERRKLAFDYRARSTDEKTRRTVSPQRLTHYRDNWYLDAWDETKQELRSFSIDRISGARFADGVARDVADEELNAHLAGSYGIFSGAPKGWATILFSAKAARWVADEHWHSQQQGRFLPDGRYELKVPYSVPRELLMDVLHYGADAEIVEPKVLREQARAHLQLAFGELPAIVMGGVPVSAASRQEPIALALGAGGARGLAQIGVIEALQARGLRIVAIAGASSGALVAALAPRASWMRCATGCSAPVVGRCCACSIPASAGPRCSPATACWRNCVRSSARRASRTCRSISPRWRST